MVLEGGVAPRRLWASQGPGEAKVVRGLLHAGCCGALKAEAAAALQLLA
jgi:hypothetical protein